jgi:hypothetical protein
MTKISLPPFWVLALLLLLPLLTLCTQGEQEDPQPGPSNSAANHGAQENTPPQAGPSGPKAGQATAGQATSGQVTSPKEKTLPPVSLPELTPDGRGLLRLVLSTYMDGHLEPCGCASAQSGGLDRRAFWLNSRKEQYDAILEGGNLVAGRTPLEELKLMTILQVLGSNLTYPVLPLGARDLEMGARALQDFDEAFGPPFVATDLRGKDGAAPFKTFGIVEASSAEEGSNDVYKILVLSLVGQLAGEQPKKEELSILPPREAVAAALQAAGARGTAYDLVVVFTNSGGATIGREMARSVEGVDLVVCTDTAEDEAQETYESYVFKRKDGSEHVRRVLFAGGRGKTLLIWHGQPAQEGAWITAKTEKVRLGVPAADPEVAEVMLAFKRSLTDEKVLEQMAEQRPTKNGHAYIGNDSCTMCHVEAAQIWKKTPHAKAWESLVQREARDQWPVTRHPECVSCHVAGYGEKTGFVNIERSAHLKDVGCESCHGAGGGHVKFWKEEAGKLGAGTPEYEKAKKRATMGKIGMESCYVCHTLEQSPGFLPQERWKLIEHK